MVHFGSGLSLFNCGSGTRNGQQRKFLKNSPTAKVVATIVDSKPWKRAIGGEFQRQCPSK
jgi:hypothetical protein